MIGNLIQALAQPAVVMGHRMISSCDENALTLAEATAFKNAVAEVRSQSGAARIVARGLLARFGYPDATIVKSSSGAPVWPSGIVGSIAHDRSVAVCAVARRSNYLGLGLDIEPNIELPGEVITLVATRRERARYGADFIRGRHLFSIKEAVYKAVYPLGGRFLEFHDIDVDLNAQTAFVTDGPAVRVKAIAGSHVLALAWIENRP